MNNKPKVSVCMITYNHEKHIEEAINGVLMQECDFEIELIISNDCSTDKTNQKIQNLLQNHPKSSLIKYHNHEKNLGMMNNFIFTINQCSGQYIAICEGDDYWTDALKLKKQIEFMSVNPEISFTFHRAEILHKNKMTLSYIGNNFVDRKTIETKYFLRKAGARYCSASAVFRNNVFENLPQWLLECHVADFPIMFLALQKGKIGYLEDVMCVYRFAGEGSWSSVNIKPINRLKNIKKMVNLNIIINRETKREFEKYLKLNVLEYLLNKLLIETQDYFKKS